MASAARLPTLYVPHGGGPWPWVERLEALHGDMRRFFETLPVNDCLLSLPTYGGDALGPKGPATATLPVDDCSLSLPTYGGDALGPKGPATATLPTRLGASREPSAATHIRAILVISAHWEAPQVTVMAAAKPPLLYDYYGFPQHTYALQWPAPGAPELAAEIVAQLQRSGIEAQLDSQRGFDHGCFVPLALTYPQADIPTLQLSLVEDLDPERHLRIGAALEPLRQQGVLIFGSGMSYHNMEGFERGSSSDGAPGRTDAETFDSWLAQAVVQPGPARWDALKNWETAPAARSSHPREEHLLPLHVVAGAASDDAATLPYRDSVLGVRVSAVQFG